MTVQPTRDQLREAAEGHLRFGGGGDDLAHGVLTLLDQLAAAEARIKAVENVLDRAEATINRHPAYTHGGQRMHPIVNGADIRRALQA